jgi:glycosyltransferase involved in cell wall biosynthesis
MRLLQVCNVGNVCGGTAACAWTIARALPNFEHSVLFLTSPTEETRLNFRHCEILDGTKSSRRNFTADVAVLHNTSPERCPPIEAEFAIHYLHSKSTPCPVDRQIVCSHWLQSQAPELEAAAVVTQPVPKPLRSLLHDARPLRNRLVVGRLCTPSSRKWPPHLISFYERLARRFPSVDWEFVGCPGPLRPRLLEACRGQAVFHAPGWNARRRLWSWDALLYHHPTLTESFGRVCAEAMRAGCVPIFDDRGGFREQIAAGTGWLCGQFNAFEAALDALHAPETRRSLSRAAESFADDAFSLRRFAETFQSLLTQARRSATAAAGPVFAWTTPGS